MKVSVVLSTYNGEKYLEEQLDSLRLQSRCADEVLISDDCSCDNTVPMIKDYIDKYQLKNWILFEQKENVGWKVNFSQTLQLAKGDLIFPCDQDDIWHLDKIEKMCTAMDQNSQILLLASGFTPFYEDNGKKMHISSDLKREDGKIYPANFLKEFFYIHRPGCVYCFRNSLLRYFKSYSFHEYPHDAFLWRTANLKDGLFFYPQPTIDYRRHSENATGREKRDVEKKLSTMKYYKKAVESALLFIEQEDVKNIEIKKQILNQYYKWCNLRISFLEEGKIVTWLKLMKYRNCYYSMKTYFADFAMVWFKVRG